MLSMQEALSRVLVEVTRRPAERVVLAEAHGRVLAEVVRSPRDVPPWDNSAMDGYAVRARDTADGEVVLRLNEVLGAGAVATIRVSGGTATSIMTGAPMPEGADAVVMIEHSDASQLGAVRLRGLAHVGQHVRPRAGDVAKGDRVLEAGTTLTPAQVGLIASLGMAEVEVVRRPVVAILCTGDEIVPAGQPLQPGQIYSSNNVVLAGMVQAAGGVVRDLGVVPDRMDALVAALESALEADVVLTTGGVSMGVYDFVRDAFREVGVPMDFWKVAMKPGKPLAFGVARRGGRAVPLFGLPGNPVSCVVNFAQFVRPWLRQVLGDPRPYLPVVDAVAGEAFRRKPGRAKLDRVVIEAGPAGWIVRSTGTQSSGVLTSMAKAHGLLLVPPDGEGFQEGDAVKVQLLDPHFLDGAEPCYPW